MLFPPFRVLFPTPKHFPRTQEPLHVRRVWQFAAPKAASCVRLDVGITDGRLTQEGQFTLKGLKFGPSEGLVGHRGPILLYFAFCSLTLLD
jgi:hypothetical protein